MEKSDKIKYLRGLKAQGAGFDKRFMRDLPCVYDTDPENVTDKQWEWVDKLLYKYRRQWLKSREYDVKNLTEKQFRFYILKYENE